MWEALGKCFWGLFLVMLASSGGLRIEGFCSRRSATFSFVNSVCVDTLNIQDLQPRIFWNWVKECLFFFFFLEQTVWGYIMGNTRKRIIKTCVSGERKVYIIIVWESWFWMRMLIQVRSKYPLKRQLNFIQFGTISDSILKQEKCPFWLYITTETEDFNSEFYLNQCMLLQ